MSSTNLPGKSISRETILLQMAGWSGLVVLVLAIDKREDLAAYRSAVERLLAGKQGK